MTISEYKELEREAKQVAKENGYQHKNTNHHNQTTHYFRDDDAGESLIIKMVN